MGMSWVGNGWVQLTHAQLWVGYGYSFQAQCRTLLGWKGFFWCSKCGQSRWMYNILSIGKASVYVMPCFVNRNIHTLELQCFYRVSRPTPWLLSRYFICTLRCCPLPVTIYYLNFFLCFHMIFNNSSLFMYMSNVI